MFPGLGFVYQTFRAVNWFDGLYVNMARFTLSKSRPNKQHLTGKLPNNIFVVIAGKIKRRKTTSSTCVVQLFSTLLASES